MEPFDEIKAYRDTVCQQVRWKKAKVGIAHEIENHLCDQRDAYMAKGDDEKTATGKAVAQMGDAVWIGQELDKTHRPKPQWALITLTGILMGMGLAVQYLVDTASSSLNTFSPLPFLTAWVLFTICYFIDFSVFGRCPLQIYAGTLILSAFGVLFSNGLYQGRAYWILGPFSFSLAYLSLIFPVAFTLLVYTMRNKGYRGILLCGIGFLPFAFILMMVPSFSGLVLYTLSSLCVLCFAISKGWFKVHKSRGLMLVLIPAFTLAAFNVLALSQGYAHRLWVFLHPDQDSLGSGYIYFFIRDLLSSSSLLGQGKTPRHGTIMDYLPSMNTDYTLTYLIHQYGFIIFLIILTALTVFSVIGLCKALKEKSVLGSLIALSIVLTFILQCAFYLAANLGYGLIAPLSLPFISYGKSALCLNAALTGFMLSIFRTGDAYEDRSLSLKEGAPLISYKDGTLSIRLKN